MSSYRVAVVTGANRGIGRACALGLSAKGYRVVLIARNQADLQKTADEAARRGVGPPPIVAPLDITDTPSVERLFQEVIRGLPRLDVLVNNAGLFTAGTLDASMADFTRLLQTNVLAPFSFLKAAVPIMKEQAGGHIINIASRAGKYGLPGEGAYSASKHGLVALNEALYRELAPHGISVTAICPGWVNTKMAHSSTLEPADMIQPEDIAKTVDWLLSLSPNVCVKEVLIECHKSIH